MRANWVKEDKYMVTEGNEIWGGKNIHTEKQRGPFIVVGNFILFCIFYAFYFSSIKIF